MAVVNKSQHINTSLWCSGNPRYKSICLSIVEALIILPLAVVKIVLVWTLFKTTIQTLLIRNQERRWFSPYTVWLENSRDRRHDCRERFCSTWELRQDLRLPDLAWIEEDPSDNLRCGQIPEYHFYPSPGDGTHWRSWCHSEQFPLAISRYDDALPHPRLKFWYVFIILPHLSTGSQTAGDMYPQKIRTTLRWGKGGNVVDWLNLPYYFVR